MLVLLTSVSVRTSSAEVIPQKTAILKCFAYKVEGIRLNPATMNIKIYFIRLKLSIGAFQYEVISLSDRSVVGLLPLEDGAELMVINRNNGSFERSELAANLYGTQRLSWSGSCSPTPI